LFVVGRVWQKRRYDFEFGHDGNDGRQHLAIERRRDEQHQHRCCADRFVGELRKQLRPHGGLDVIDVWKHFGHDGRIFALDDRQRFGDDPVVLAVDKLRQHVRHDGVVFAFIRQRLQHDGVVFAFVRQRLQQRDEFLVVDVRERFEHDGFQRVAQLERRPLRQFGVEHELDGRIVEWNGEHE